MKNWNDRCAKCNYERAVHNQPEPSHFKSRDACDSFVEKPRYAIFDIIDQIIMYYHPDGWSADPKQAFVFECKEVAEEALVKFEAEGIGFVPMIECIEVMDDFAV